MPTYDYECRACGHHFEHFQTMTSRKLRKCPACEQRKLVRLLGSGAGLIFRGSGFYETDYKRSGSGAPPKETSSSKEGDGKPDKGASTGGGDAPSGASGGSDD